MTKSKGVPSRRITEFIALGGALLAAVFAQVQGAALMLAIALACAAASALGFMLHKGALQALAWALTVLSLIGAITTFESADWLAYGAMVGFVVTLGASRFLVRYAPAWAHTVQKRQASAPPDPWKEQDKGIDPTDGMPEQGDSR